MSVKAKLKYHPRKFVFPLGAALFYDFVRGITVLTPHEKREARVLRTVLRFAQNHSCESRLDGVANGVYSESLVAEIEFVVQVSSYSKPHYILGRETFRLVFTGTAPQSGFPMDQEKRAKLTYFNSVSFAQLLAHIP